MESKDVLLLHILCVFVFACIVWKYCEFVFEDIHVLKECKQFINYFIENVNCFFVVKQTISLLVSQTNLGNQTCGCEENGLTMHSTL